MISPCPVESADHVHPTRMRHIGDADLTAALGVDPWRLRAGLAARTGRDPVAQVDLAAADELLDRQVDFLVGTGRSGLYGLHYLRWLTPLCHAYELTGDDRYANGFGRFFDDWYSSRDHVVGDWPGLDVVWYSLGVWARATVLLPALTTFASAPGLSDQTYARMLKTVVGGARWAAEEHDAFRPGNWQFVCAAELLHVAAFLPAAPEAEVWATVGRTRTVEHLDRDFFADGGHVERSPGYHSLCLEALRRAAVVAEELAEHPTYAAARRWLLTMTTPGGWVPPWQDSTLVRAAVPPVVGRSTLLADSGYAVLRNADAYLAVNVGDYVEHELESHSHLAVTDFVIAMGDQALAVEAGGPPTYDDPRYQDWYRAPAAHNMVTVDGAEMTTDRDCVVDVFADAGDVCVLATHHTGYPRRVDRRITFVGRDPAYWLFHDGVDAPATWSILAPAPWEPVTGGYRSGALGVFPALAHAASFDAGPGLVPGPDAYAEVYALRLHAPDGRFDVLVVPTVGEWSLAADGAGWRVTTAEVVDVLRGGRWERSTVAGDLVATEEVPA